jgi:hypothetical protein
VSMAMLNRRRVMVVGVGMAWAVVRMGMRHDEWIDIVQLLRILYCNCTSSEKRRVRLLYQPRSLSTLVSIITPLQLPHLHQVMPEGYYRARAGSQCFFELSIIFVQSCQQKSLMV